MYQKKLKQKAKRLRLSGLTHREIAKKLKVATSTAHEWTKGIILTSSQRDEVRKRWYENYIQKFRAYVKKDPVGFKKDIQKRLKPYQYKKQFSKKDLIKRITKFYLLHKRIPLKRELGETRAYRERFGTWNNAIRTAGFSPNPVLFAKRFIAEDGHPCDSFTEKVIDDWFSKNNIPHERNMRYGKTKMTADFKIKQNVIIEFFGLAGVQKEYDRLLRKKRRLCKKLKFKLIEIYPKDIYPKNCLSTILKSILSL